MPRSIPTQVRPELLVWARTTAGLTQETAAKKAHIKLATLQEWERGTRAPSIAQLRKLGEVYKHPLAVFFLSEPPKGFDPQREFRRLPGITPENESPELRFALRTALFRREAAKEVYERLGERIPTAGEAISPDDGPEIVGTRIREMLGVNWESQVEWPSAYAALSAWREAIEGAGVLVFQTLGALHKKSIGQPEKGVMAYSTASEATGCQNSCEVFPAKIGPVEFWHPVASLAVL